MMQKNPREIILDTLLDIDRHNIYSNTALHTALSSNQFMSKQDRSFISRMTEGVTEQRIRLDYIINQFSKTKVHKCKPLIRCVLRMGVYEIYYMDSIPQEATCNECVKLVSKRGFNGLKGFVNGVLRNICRRKDDVHFPERSDGLEKYYSVKYSISEAVADVLLHTYDEETVVSILESGYEKRGTSIRVNTNRISVEAYKKQLEDIGIRVKNGAYNDTSLMIENYDYVRKIPGFFDGFFAVQDESSCLAVKAAGIKEGQTVLDVCAAPGGKTMYAAELTGESGIVLSRDISDEKTELIEENAERMGYHNIKIMVYDALKPDKDLTEKMDVVLCDLPCSGLGIMGRKNDIKYNVTKEKIAELAAMQRHILENASGYVKPGGVLVYSTCTITRQENEDNVKWFTDNHHFVLDSLVPYMPEVLHDKAEKGYMTLLQGVDSSDGFFIARFVRR